MAYGQCSYIIPDDLHGNKNRDCYAKAILIRIKDTILTIRQFFPYQKSGGSLVKNNPTLELTIGISVYNVANADNKVQAVAEERGSITGAVVGGELGAKIGASIGSLFAGGGAVPGAIIGGIVGAIVGGIIGKGAGDEAYDKLKN